MIVSEWPVLTKEPFSAAFSWLLLDHCGVLTTYCGLKGNRDILKLIASVTEHLLVVD